MMITTINSVAISIVNVVLAIDFPSVTKEKQLSAQIVRPIS